MADITDERGVSTLVGYTLNIALSVLLIGGLLVAGTGVVTHQRERVIQEELEVVGRQLTTDLMATDRLARASDGGTVRLTSRHPRTVADTNYRVRVRDAAAGGKIVLSTSDPAVSVTVPFRNITTVVPGTWRGGTVTIRYNGSVIRMEGGG